MKTSFLILALMFFSLISGAIGAWGVTNLQPHFSGNTSQNTSIQLSPPMGKSELQSIEASITSTVQNIAPSVVSIVINKDLVVYRQDPWGFFQESVGTVRREVGGGSGFFISSDGKILTNKHVVSDTSADYTVILSNGTEYDAEILALDPLSDLAIIQVINTSEQFIPLKTIDNQTQVNIGEFAIAVGNALSEFQNSVSLGIVSGKDRIIEAEGDTLSGLIQTDAAINPGNSGGPLLNLDGRVIGINTAIAASGNNIGFAIGLTQERINYMLESITSDGRIKRPFIGISYIQNSPGIARELGLSVDYGAYIFNESGSVLAGSSAELAGIEPGDIILEVNNKKINSSNQLGNIIQNTIPGTILKLKILKITGDEVNIELELGEY